MTMQMNDRLDDDVVNDINMTPLIDVMLVLLIIFIVTLPIMNHAVKVDLPQAASAPAKEAAQDIDVSILADGSILWNKQPVDATQMAEKIKLAAAQDPIPALLIFADRHVEYDRVAHVLSAAQAGGLSKLNFVTQTDQP